LELYDDLAPGHDDVVKHQVGDLRRISHLGKGSYCDVSLSICRSTKEQFALKKLDQSKIESQQDFITAAPDLAIEGHYLARLDHPNIIKLRGISAEKFSESFSEGGDGYFLTMEVMEETLKDRLLRWQKDSSCYKTRKGLGPLLNMKTKKLDVQSMYGRIRTVAIGVAQALRYIQEQGIVVRDLKSDNIGFHAETGQVCLFDFGFARELEICRADEICGTPRYMAPEVLRGEGHSLKSDVYSFGVVLHEVATLYQRKRSKKTLIESQDDLISICNSLSELQLNEVPCEKVKSLIEECLSVDPEKRPSFENIVKRLVIAVRGDTLSTKSRSLPILLHKTTSTQKGLAESNSTLETLPDYEFNELSNQLNAAW